MRPTVTIAGPYFFSNDAVLKGKKYKKTVSFYIMPSFCCNKFLVSHNIAN